MSDRSGRPPNILFLIADDHRHDVLSGVGTTEARTPHLDALAARGVRMTQHRCQAGMHGAICAPSRATILTGREVLSATQGTTVDSWEASIVAEDAPTLPEVLRGAGYRTYQVGKWHSGAPAHHRSFDDGAQIFMGGMSDHDAVPVHDFDPSGEYPASSKRVAEGFSTDIFTEATISFLERHQPGRDGAESPFFLWTAFTAPHDPRTPPPEFARMYDPESLQLPPNFLADPVDTGQLEIRDEKLAALPRDPAEIRQHLADYYGMVSHLDDRIGQILQRLEDLGLAEDTIVVYTADHGLAMGQHGLMGKQSLHEHSARIPLIMTGPGIVSASSPDPLSIHADLMPTLLGLAGAPVPDGVQGKDLGDVLTGSRTTAPRDVVHSAYAERARAATDGRHTLIRNLHPVTRTELFDLQEDPWQMRDIAGEPGSAAIIERLSRSLETWQVQQRDPLLS